MTKQKLSAVSNLEFFKAFKYVKLKIKNANFKLISNVLNKGGPRFQYSRFWLFADQKTWKTSNNDAKAHFSLFQA